MNEVFFIWQVSTVGDTTGNGTTRKYHHFSTMFKATRFIRHWINEYVENTGYYPHSSLNISCRQSNGFSRLPSRIDDMKTKEFLAKREQQRSKQ